MALSSIALMIALGASTPSVPVEQYELPNGLSVLLSEDHRLPVVATEVVYLVGSAHERPGRSGFAHLFEHLMFQGTKNFDHDYFTPFEPIGGDVNGTTNEDRTNFFERVPSNYLELCLWMESDRMENLILTQAKFENQRDVVKNERRQSYDNRPYGRDWEELGHLLYPVGHPYYEQPIGSMRDLDAASVQDAKDFFKEYYAPKNAVLVVVGDFATDQVKTLIDGYFGHMAPGHRAETPKADVPKLDGVKRAERKDKVSLPRVYLAWHTPELFAAGDAELDLLSGVLTGGKTSRLYKPLVYDEKVAKEVQAFQASQRLGSTFVIQVTAAPGVSIDKLYASLERALTQALATPPSADEVERSRNAYKKGFYERVEGVASRASLLGTYFLHTGKGEYLDKDLERYLKATPDAVWETAKKYLDLKHFARLDVLPIETPKADAAKPDPKAPDAKKPAATKGAAQ
jgi:zinc protease